MGDARPHLSGNFLRVPADTGSMVAAVFAVELTTFHGFYNNEVR